MNEVEIRLECLRLAVQVAAMKPDIWTDVVALANQYVAFVDGKLSADAA